MRYLFEDCVLDIDRRELRRGAKLLSVTPQVFDVLYYLIRNRERVVSKDDLIAAVWHGRIVSDAALTTRINVARNAIGDSGDDQRLIKTLPTLVASRTHPDELDISPDMYPVWGLANWAMSRPTPGTVPEPEPPDGSLYQIIEDIRRENRLALGY